MNSGNRDIEQILRPPHELWQGRGFMQKFPSFYLLLFMLISFFDGRHQFADSFKAQGQF
jgi:hypothetical protein